MGTGLDVLCFKYIPIWGEQENYRINKTMKIWIDFINSPQVSFFEPLIEDLSINGHEFILTCRDSANTVQLIKKRNWQFTIIGNRAEKSFIKKLFSFPVRIFSLYRHLRNKKIGIAIGQSSFYLPMTAKFLGVPSIYTNDNEHALGNIPSFIFWIIDFSIFTF